MIQILLKEAKQEEYIGQNQILQAKKYQEMLALMKASTQNLLKILNILILKKFMINCLKNIN